MSHLEPRRAPENPSSDRIQDPGPPPPNYAHNYHPKYFWKAGLVPGAVGAVITLFLAFMLLNAQSSQDAWTLLEGVLLSAALSIYAVYRGYWAWGHRYIRVSATNGVLEIYQGGKWWLGLPPSPKDPHPLDGLSLPSPTQTIPESIFFKDSATLSFIMGDKTYNVNDVLYVEEILAIQTWRQDVVLYMQQLSADAAVDAARTNRHLLEVQTLIARRMGINVPDWD